MIEEDPAEYKRVTGRDPEKDRVSANDIYNVVTDAVDIETNFVKESLNVELIGIDSAKMTVYVKFVADHLLRSLNLNNKYNVKNPFDWMDTINLTSKQNFFEGRVSEYQKVNNDTSFGIEEEF